MSPKSSAGVVIWPHWTQLNSFSTGPVADTKFNIPIPTVLISAIGRHSRHCFYVAALLFTEVNGPPSTCVFLSRNICNELAEKTVAILPLTGLQDRSPERLPWKLHKLFSDSQKWTHLFTESTEKWQTHNLKNSMQLDWHRANSVLFTLLSQSSAVFYLYLFGDFPQRSTKTVGWKIRNKSGR